MATIQYIVIPALFLAKHAFVTVTQDISLGPENKGHLLIKSCVFSEPCCWSHLERLQMVSYHSKEERRNNLKT